MLGGEALDLARELLVRVGVVRLSRQTDLRDDRAEADHAAKLIPEAGEERAQPGDLRRDRLLDVLELEHGQRAGLVDARRRAAVR